MVLGSTLIIIAIILFGVAINAYLHGKMRYVFWILLTAGWIAVVGAGIIDEQNDRECVQEIEGFEEG